MLSTKTLLLPFISVAAIASSANANDQIKIVGSSTVYPFTSYVAEEFGATTGNKTPVVESTGTGGGMKLFCAGVGSNTPDFTNASRPMKVAEFEICQENGVKNIVGMKVGYDGVAIAQNKDNEALDLTLEQLFLALAQEVPSKDGKSLVANPYKKWSDIDNTLPNREIKMIGAPSTSGTRDSFDEMVMEHASKSFPVYNGEPYKKIRTDGVYIPGGENDNLIVQKLAQDKDAMGYFGYSFLEENRDKIKGVTLNGVEPNAKNISSGEYPIARSIFIYMKKDHMGKTKGLEEFIKLYSSEAMTGENGVLKTIGLIPMPSDEHKLTQETIKSLAVITPEMVKAGLTNPAK
ncbi:MAG TPA: PstS family phosphate ABC transporter substrate-binding protein [Epsilonproteobacteria bacterium]|nr:PstS family phosphate ABC transporter substrate-binding protein [Campylobacterota bacterium]